MTKLLMISGNSAADILSGVRGAFYNTLGELYKYWDRIDIICTGKNNTDPGCVFGNVFIHPSPWHKIFQPFWIKKCGNKLAREHYYNLMTVQEYPPFYNGFGTWLLWRKNKIPYVLQIFHVPGYPKSAGIKESFYRWLAKKFIARDAKNVAAVQVMNKTQTPKFLITAGVPENKIVFLNAIYLDLETFKPLGLEKKYDVIFVGRLADNKGIDLFLDSVRLSGVNAVVVGRGPEEKKVESFIKKYNLGGRIKYAGWVKDSKEVAELINESKILAVTSFNEGGPRVALEAMACGVPVISTKVGLMKDIVSNGENGWLVGWDAQEIAETIKKAISDEELLPKMAAECVKTATAYEKKEAIAKFVDGLKQYMRP
ncbi:MAG: group 1 glycosyl transferase [Parcubacteria group bacterium Licking1014_17]|nr:MAG: group 1 glycosyl transferase [Parcubacteria group bacterium Licking1014_17]